MKLNFKKENLVNTLLTIAVGVFLVLAIVGLCLSSLKVSTELFGENMSETMSFKDLIEGDNLQALLQTAFAFAIIGIVAVGVLAAFVVLEGLGIAPKITKWKWTVSAFVIVCAVIVISCLGSWAADHSFVPLFKVSVGAGTALFFTFSILAAICGAFVGCPLFETKKKTSKKK